MDPPTYPFEETLSMNLFNQQHFSRLTINSKQYPKKIHLISSRLLREDLFLVHNFIYQDQIFSEPCHLQSRYTFPISCNNAAIVGWFKKDLPISHLQSSALLFYRYPNSVVYTKVCTKLKIHSTVLDLVIKSRMLISYYFTGKSMIFTL